MIATPEFTGTVSIVDGKITEIDLTLKGEPVSEIRRIMALKQITENYVKEYERARARR